MKQVKNIGSNIYFSSEIHRKIFSTAFKKKLGDPITIRKLKTLLHLKDCFVVSVRLFPTGVVGNGVEKSTWNRLSDLNRRNMNAFGRHTTWIFICSDISILTRIN